MTAITTSAAPTLLAAPSPIAVGSKVGTKRGAPVPSLLHQPTLIVLGRDDSGKPHASFFDETEQKLAAKAAALMGMHALSVKGDELKQLAGRLPHGRVFASGRAFVPFVKAALFDELVAHLPKGTKVAAVRLVSSKPVMAANEPNQDEAGGETGTTSAEAADASLPKDWSKIAIGDLVLASEGEQDGWYESIVEEAKADDLFVLRWRDWPELPHFVRRRQHIALLHPDFDPA